MSVRNDIHNMPKDPLNQGFMQEKYKKRIFKKSPRENAKSEVASIFAI